LTTTTPPNYPIVGSPKLRGYESFGELQRAVCQALAEHLDPIKVYDYVPEKADLPYVVWGTAWGASRDYLNVAVDRIWFQIDVWSDYRGYAESIGIAEEITTRLHHAVVYLEGWNPIHLVREQPRESRDPDGVHRRVMLTFYSPYVSPDPTEPEDDNGP
jgi:hypothetical protein